MSRRSPEHPLDIALLDYVEGLGDPVERELVAKHLAECLPCRIKRQRLSGVAPMGPTDPLEIRMPLFAQIELEHASGIEAQPGELWLTASDETAIVLVRSVRDDGRGVVVLPVTLDVEVADEGAVILDEDASPIGIPIAIYEDLVVSLPLDALVERVIPANPDIDLLALGDGVEHSRGSALEGPADPRFEVRQYLVDRLEALEPYTPESDREDPGTLGGESRLAFLRSELLMRRGPGCAVEALPTLPIPPGSGKTWTGIASILDLRIRVLVVETPSGLRSRSDYAVAQALFTRLDGSALAVCTPLNELADIYDAPTLFRAVEVPEGHRSSAPLLSGLSLPDAVAKFLDQRRPLVSSVEEPTHIASRVDVPQLMADEVIRAVAATSGRASRLGAEKAAGYLKIPSWTSDLAHILLKTLEPDFDPQLVTNLVPEDLP